MDAELAPQRPRAKERNHHPDRNEKKNKQQPEARLKWRDLLARRQELTSGGQAGPEPGESYDYGSEHSAGAKHGQGEMKAI